LIIERGLIGGENGAQFLAPLRYCLKLTKNNKKEMKKGGGKM
jgi:hypothetical protein